MLLKLINRLKLNQSRKALSKAILNDCENDNGLKNFNIQFEETISTMHRRQDRLRSLPENCRVGQKTRLKIAENPKSHWSIKELAIRGINAEKGLLTKRRLKKLLETDLDSNMANDIRTKLGLPIIETSPQELNNTCLANDICINSYT